MERLIDLHIHTTASDGSLSPREAVEMARDLGLAAVAVTDHDTTAGIRPALEAGARLGVEVIPGMELAAQYGTGSVHILGYFIDPGAPALREAMAWSVRARETRNRQIVQALAADGFPISMDELTAAFPDTVLGRPHIGAFLVSQGRAASVPEAFDRWLGTGRPYYRPRRHMPLDRAVSAMRQAGGLAAVAHPLQYGFPPAVLERFLRDAKAAGCAALEAYYSRYGWQEQEQLCEMAARLGLALSGGSDFHGDRKPDIKMGSGIRDSIRVPYTVLEALRAVPR